MSLNLDLLAEAGFDNDALRRVFTAQIRDNATDEENKENERLVVIRQRLERMIESRLVEHIAFTLKHHHYYSAVDLAWDSAPINKADVPLMLYAQKKITADKCLTLLKDSCGDCTDVEDYVARDEDNEPYLKPPRLNSVKTNLIRSIVTRRVAAQSNRFNNLWPFFKYEPRHRSTASALRADLTNQRMDIMADQYNYRSLQTQIIRDMLLYGKCIVFPRCAWERDVHWMQIGVKDPDGVTPRKSKVTREGVSFDLPHVSRTYFDFRHPISSLNTDTGCEYAGYWEVVRYGEIRNNPAYYNQYAIAYTHRVCGWLQDHSAYFDQYYNDVVSPANENQMNLSADNDPESNLGVYASAIEDAAVFLTDHFMKVVPVEIGIGKYPYPVWIHLKVANNRTVIHSEILPSLPCAVFSHNSSDNRLVNLSMAMELMPSQDQLDNMHVQIIEEAKRDLYSVVLLNTDIFPEGEEGMLAKESFEQQMRSENFYVEPAMLATSFSKMKEMGIEPSAENIFQIIRSERPTNMQNLFQAVDRIWAMAEKMVALSPQEQGQVAPREVSATEVQVVATTTEAVYNYISDSLDAGRTAWKRIALESMLSMGEKEFELPTSHRYPKELLARMNLRSVEGEGSQYAVGEISKYLVRGNISTMDTAYNWNTRDGAERTSNQQAAQTLSTMYSQLLQSPVGQMMPIHKHIEILNEIMRLVGTSIDLADPSTMESNVSPMQAMGGAASQEAPPSGAASGAGRAPTQSMPPTSTPLALPALSGGGSPPSPVATP